MPLFLNRRMFLKAAVAVPLLGPVQSSQRRISPLGLQLYTVRSEMEKNFEATLARVAAIGYKEVEFAGYFGRSPRDVQKILSTNGLKGVSSHVGYGTLGDQWQGIVDAAHVMGHQYLVVPSIDGAARAQADIWHRASERFNRAGELCRAAGITFAYHNHQFEFAGMATRKRPYEIMLELTDPSLVSMQMDLGWITAAGQDPAAFFRRYPGRFSSVHVKDLKAVPRPDEPAVQTDVGQGIINWKRLLADCWSAGIRHYFVEHDAPASPFDSIETSFRYVNGLRLSEAAR